MILRRIPIVALALAVFLSGCAQIPFREHERVDMRNSDPLQVVKAFSDALPEKVSLLSSLVFRYNFISKTSALGTIEADVPGRWFSVVGLSPLGVKLFSVEADDEGIRDRYVIGPLARRGDLPKAVAGDIRRIYFDRVPSLAARVRIKKNSIEFVEFSGDGFLVHVFAGPEKNLVMKKYYEDGDLSWKVGYYEYTREGGRLYPGGIVLTDLKHGYRLMARTKKIYVKKD